MQFQKPLSKPKSNISDSAHDLSKSPSLSLPRGYLVRNIKLLLAQSTLRGPRGAHHLGLGAQGTAKLPDRGRGVSCIGCYRSPRVCKSVGSI
ncbi:hypothetical protein NPIL_680521 [Nephila pilipes]|uniref:Uncharacterized protein n=1 Tax=Nephila pilipes TaxID=299642 RepID=A0A8X6NML3_NEPPI|nr:hypothetical protein NPIL_680521 [Nephila pilipes]